MGKVEIPTAESWPATADAVVIGGGIVGIATAFWLSRAGLDTVLVEMRGDLAGLTSSKSIECFRAQFTEPAMSELALASIRIFENFGEIIGIPDYDISLHYSGYLFVTDEPGLVDSLKASVAKHRELGVTDSEFLAGAELRARFPFLSERALAGTFRQRDGSLSSHAAAQGFAKGSRARFLLDTRATGIRQDGQGICGVDTTRGAIATRLVVNAAGPFAGVVGRMAGLELPVQPVRRQKAYILPRPQIPQDAPLVIDVARDAYWRPETGGAFIAWVDPDDKVREPSENLPTDWDYPAIVLDKLIPLTPFWEQVCDDLKHGQVLLSAGQYVYTPDDQPLIGPLPEVPGFYVNCGYWAGVMLSAAAGQRIADLVSGKLAPGANLLRPTRYAEGITYTGDSFLRGHH
jgi:sarcosine oxidase, subunit beta